MKRKESPQNIVFSSKKTIKYSENTSIIIKDPEFQLIVPSFPQIDSKLLYVIIKISSIKT